MTPLHTNFHAKSIVVDAFLSQKQKSTYHYRNSRFFSTYDTILTTMITWVSNSVNQQLLKNHDKSYVCENIVLLQINFFLTCAFLLNNVTAYVSRDCESIKRASTAQSNNVFVFTAQKMKFLIQNFFSKCDQIRCFLRIWSYLLKKSLMENFIFFVQCLINGGHPTLAAKASRFVNTFVSK